MDTILITDTQTPLGTALVKQFLQEEFRVIAASTDGTGKTPAGDKRKKNIISIPWNRPSPLSCKHLLLQGTQKSGPLDTALLLVPPPLPSAAFGDLKYLDVETVFDMWLKGTILLARDLLEYFIIRRRGSFSFVSLFPSKSDTPSLLDDLCREGLLVIFRHVVEAAKPHKIKINSFFSRTTNTKAYSDFIIKTFFDKCNKTSGKLFYFQWK